MLLSLSPTSLFPAKCQMLIVETTPVSDFPPSAKSSSDDGYHCLCVAYSLDEDAVIPCKIV